MKIAILDCFAGISGDMTLGALIDSGVPVSYLEKQITKLGLRGYNIEVSKIKKSHISATKVKIEYDEKQQPERKFKAISDMIKKAAFSASVTKKAIDAFKILGEAEAVIHASTLRDIHFHEVGAIDSIIDLIGSIIGFDYLGIKKIYSAAVPLGTGFTQTEHGVMPVPAPAALKILEQYPVVYRNSNYEMTTPTGATLIKLLSDGLVPEGLGYIQQNTGYGAGTKDTPNWPNVLRLICGETTTSHLPQKLFMLETNIDDMNPEIYSYLTEKLLKSGANDVFLTPTIMKKGRPGTLVSVLVSQKFLKNLELIIFQETTSIGVRKYPVERTCLERKEKKIKTKYGDLKVKAITYEGKEYVRPEYEACKKAAEKHGIRLLDLYLEVEKQND